MLLPAARQECLQRALDRAGTGASNCIADVGPGLCPVELGGPPHESSAVVRLVLPAVAAPGSLQPDVLTDDGAMALFLSGLRGARFQTHHMRVACLDAGHRNGD